MKMHSPTKEQLAIIARAKETKDNILVNALAGAAKTSSLELLAHELPDTRILYLAFNKKNAVEAQERLPDNCKAMTLNSLGHRTWQEAIGKRVSVETSKGYENMKSLIEQLGPGEEQTEMYARMSELMQIVRFGKACGYIPTDTYERAKRLMDDDEFFNHIDQELSTLEMELVREATLISITQAMQGLCDYDDQILMPTVFHGAFQRFPLVLVDEAQDLSALNHAMLRKLCKASRLIAVGDPCQAIYGFRGAHADSMRQLSHAFSMHEMTLSITFRCPKAVVESVLWRAPNMKYPEWAKEGSITHLEEWDVNALPEAAAIICRNNAPLFALAIKLLKNGRHAELGGSDIVKGLLTIMRKFGSSNLPAAEVLARIDNWLEVEKEKNKNRAHSLLEDRAECMRIFAREGTDLGGAIAYAQHITQLHSPLKLMTGHKAKGLEFPHVFFLDKQLIGDRDQDPNLRYVIMTRALETLTYIQSEEFVDLTEQKEALMS